MPTEPVSPVTNGTQALGLVGKVTLNGTVFTTAKSGRIVMTFNRTLRKNNFNQFYPGRPQQGRRDVQCEFSLYEDDSADTQALLAAVGTPIPMIFEIGNVAGNTWKIPLNNVLLPEPAYDDKSEDSYCLNFTGCTAKATTLTSLDETQIIIV
jgi:hypothetical protein